MLLKAADGQLSLSATDMDLEMVSSVPAQGVKPGGTTVPVSYTHLDVYKRQALQRPAVEGAVAALA